MGNMLAMLILIIYSFLAMISECRMDKNVETEYHEWILPHSDPEKMMFCPEEPCVYPPDSKESCCACKSLTSWEYYNKTLGILQVQQGKKGIILRRKSSGTSGYDKVKYNNMRMKTLPFDLCPFKRLVVLNFSRNWLYQIPDLSCLKWLDTIDLSRNRIKYLNLSQFRKNMNLRILDLSFNMLWNVEVNALFLVTIVTLILNRNYLRSYDVSNMILIERPFCKVNLSFNELVVDGITNEMNLTIKTGKTYGPGFVDFQYNNLRLVTDLPEKLGLNALKDASAVWSFGFDIRHNPIVCDCRMVPIMEMFHPFLKFMDRDYFRAACVEPPNMKGLTIYELAKTGNWKDMVCELKEVDNCPHNCRCFYTLSGKKNHFLWTTKTVTVNCSSSNLLHFPHYVPNGDKHKLILSRNSISELSARKYFSTTWSIDVSNNSITKIEFDSINALLHTHRINLTENDHMTRLPKSLVRLDPCVFEFPRVSLECTCDILWLKHWLESGQTVGKNCNSDKFFCKDKTQEISIKNVNVDFFQCNENNQYVRTILLTILSCLGSMIAIICTVTHFHHEIFIISRKTIFHCQNDNNKLFTVDVFISYDENRSDIRQWLHHTLIPTLTKSGFTASIPEISIMPGVIRSEETLNIMRKCKTFVVILSDNYFEESSLWASFEWENIWRRYRTVRGHELILINFDLLETADIRNRTGKALIRTGNALEFHNQEGNFLEQVMYRLKSVSANDIEEESSDVHSHVTTDESTPLLRLSPL